MKNNPNMIKKDTNTADSDNKKYDARENFSFEVKNYERDWKNYVSYDSKSNNYSEINSVTRTTINIW